MGLKMGQNGHKIDHKGYKCIKKAINIVFGHKIPIFLEELGRPPLPT